jgi:hypothetical protein
MRTRAEAEGIAAHVELQEEVTMSAKAAGRSGAARRPGKRKAVAAAARPRVETPAEASEASEADDWVEAEDDRTRLEEGEMEILLTGHAATHGFEDEDNWLIKSEEESWGER